MWNQLKQLGRSVMKKLGLIQDLKKIKDHKRINVDEEEYNRIDFNKRLYQGHVDEWHNLKYSGTKKVIERKQMSLNMPKVLAKKMARLVANEGMNISLAKKSDKADKWELVQDVFNSSKFIREFQRYVEYMFAMGGVAVEIYRDGDEVKLAYATADAFFPLSNDTEQVDEAVIANRFKEGEYYYTLLKWHEWGKWTDAEGSAMNYRIKNELYRSKNQNAIGEYVPVTHLYKDMEPETFFNREKPLFVYIKPNEANNKNITSPLGVSLFENSYDTIRMLDVMYDFWYNEFRLGKRRVAVPDYMVKTAHNINGQPYVYFDDSEELFVALNSQELEEFAVKDLTVDLRVEQVVDSIQSLLDVLAMQVGLSPGTFTFKQGGIKTATEVVSENSETYQTRSSHISVIEDAIRDLIVAVYEVATLDNDEEDDEPLDRMDISIDFNDGVFTDSQSLFKFWSDGYRMGLVPLKEAVIRIYKLSEEEAEEWIAELGAERVDSMIRNRQAMAQAELEIET